MNLSEIEARLANATPGPWLLPESARSGRQMVFVTGEFGTYNICDSAGEMDTANAELVAHAPTDLAELIAEVKRLQAELAKFYKCNEGKCYAWAAGIYHSDKVYHKEGE